MLNQILQADGQLLVAVQNLRMPWLDPVVSLYTQLGNAGLCGSRCLWPWCCISPPEGRGRRP